MEKVCYREENNRVISDKSNFSESIKYCRLCQGAIREKAGVNFLTCTKCGLRIQRDTNEVGGLYKVGWLNPLKNLDITGGTTPLLGQNYSKELMRTLRLKDLSRKRILDFGGGRGEMSLALQATGAQVVAVDPYSHQQLKELGLMAVESLERLVGVETFDGAIAIDVIEHLPTPWEELKMIKSLLGTGGWLYLSTPNVWGLNARVNREKWREALNPSHLLLFTPDAVERTLKQAGFEKYQRLRWRVDYSENRLIQIKDWLLRAAWLDGVLRYMAYL